MGRGGVSPSHWSCVARAAASRRRAASATNAARAASVSARALASAAACSAFLRAAASAACEAQGGDSTQGPCALKCCRHVCCCSCKHTEASLPPLRRPHMPKSAHAGAAQAYHLHAGAAPHLCSSCGLLLFQCRLLLFQYSSLLVKLPLPGFQGLPPPLLSPVRLLLLICPGWCCAWCCCCCCCG